MIAPAEPLPTKQQIMIQWDRVELCNLMPPDLTEEQTVTFYEETKGLSQWFGAVQVNEEVMQVKSPMFKTGDEDAAKRAEMDLFKLVMQGIAGKLLPKE